MTKQICFILFFNLGITISLFAQFHAGNIIVERVGNASYSPGTPAIACPVYLDEFTSTGNLVQSVAMPTSVNGLNRIFTETGATVLSNKLVGLMTLSADGRYLCLTGYDDAPGNSTPASTSSSSVNRIIGLVDGNAAISTTTRINDAFSGNYIVSATSNDGSEFWVTGTSDGVVYIPLGNTGSSTNISSTSTDLAGLTIFNGQLYASTGTSSYISIDSVGSGLPTTGSQTLRVLPNTSSPTNPTQFVFLNISGGTVLYVADLASGIFKYSLVGGTWTANGSVSGTIIGLTGTVNCAGNVVLYGTDGGGAQTGNNLFSFTDGGGFNTTISGTITSIHNAGSNIYKGVAFAPSGSASDLIISGASNIPSGRYRNITITNGGVGTLTGGNDTITGTFTVQSGGTLVCGTKNVICAPGFQSTFNLNAGGTLKIGSTLGIQATANAGNIQACTRIFSTGANYEYNGSANQIAGNGLQATVNNLTVTNTGAVGSNIITLQQSETVTGNLTINSGALDVTASNYSLSVAGNWTNSGTFTCRNGLVTMNGSSAQTLNSGGTGNPFYNLTENNSSTGVSLSTNTTQVNNLLTLTNGAMNLNHNTLIVNNNSSAAITTTNGYVVSETYTDVLVGSDYQVQNSSLGFLQWNIGTTNGIYSFPMATASGQSIPFAVQNSSSSSIGNVSVATWPAPYNVVNSLTNGPFPWTVTNLNHNNTDNSDNTVKRFWQLNKTGAGQLDAMTFSCLSTEAMNNAGNTALTNLVPQRWNPALYWEAPLTAGAAIIAIPGTDASSTVVNIPSLSPWTLTGNNVELPIHLLNFNAQYIPESKSVKVLWQTVTEINNNYFTIDRTVDGFNFETIGNLNGAGNSNSLLSYSFNDENPLKGISYYRLKQTDFNGNSTYSNLAPIAINSLGENYDTILKSYPNPASTNINLSFLAANNENVEIQISDFTGRIIQQKNVFLNQGGNSIDLDVSDIPNGLYMVSVKSQTPSEILKLAVRH